MLGKWRESEERRREINSEKIAVSGWARWACALIIWNSHERLSSLFSSLMKRTFNEGINIQVGEISLAKLWWMNLKLPQNEKGNKKNS